MIFEIGKRLLAPKIGCLEIRGNGMFVGVDDIVPYKQTDAKKHRGVEVFILGVWPPPVRVSLWLR